MAESEQDPRETAEKRAVPGTRVDPEAAARGDVGGSDASRDVRRAPAGPQDPAADPAEPMNPA
jgi:hypothetical protein